MKEYRQINRLQSEQYIGKQHIAVQRHCTAADYPQHWHDYFEIELILSGSGTHILNGQEYAVEQGDAYILTPIDFHSIKPNQTTEILNISFDEGKLPQSMLPFLSGCGGGKSYHFAPEEFHRFVMAADLLQSECETHGPCTLQLLEYLLSCFMRRESARADLSTRREHLQGIENAISYIELHFREPINLEQLAERSGYHPSYFSELFRKVTGQTYKERLCSLRINYAQMLLANGLSVSEACFAAGFGSLSNFSAAFRKKCGLSPNEYRSRMRNTPQSPLPRSIPTTERNT